MPSKKEEKNMRSILLHFARGTTKVDGYACSVCDWFYVFSKTEPDGTLPREEVDRAHARFLQHNCNDYPRVRTLKAMPPKRMCSCG